jgi:hypothetical protein
VSALTTAEQAEREALDALLASEGWRVLVAWVEREYSAEMTLERMRQQLAGVKMSDEVTQQKLVSSHLGVREAVQAVVCYPKERLARLSERSEPAVGPSIVARRA